MIKHAEQIGRQMAGPKSLPPMEAIAHERQMTLLMALYFKDVPESVPGLFGDKSPEDAIREIRNARLRALAYAVMDDASKWGDLFLNALKRAGCDTSDRRACDEIGEAVAVALEVLAAREKS